jgi:hypothetical protein
MWGFLDKGDNFVNVGVFLIREITLSMWGAFLIRETTLSMWDFLDKEDNFVNAFNRDHIYIIHI